MITKATLLARIDQVLGDHEATGEERAYMPAETQLGAACLSLCVTAYGKDSPLVKAVEGVIAQRHKQGKAGGWERVCELEGILKNLRAEVKGDLIGRLALQATGNVLSDLTGLAREMLVDGQVEVAAVLTAAAFEDSLRRFAEVTIALVTRPALSDLLNQLRQQNAIPQATGNFAVQNLAFRNDALHAHWTKIDKARVEGVLAFTEQFIRDHFV